jgi:hypothetical protein
MRRLVSLMIVLPALLISGCFMDTVIDAKGAGTMVVKFRLTTEAQLEPNRKRFESAAVKVTKATVDKDKWATYELKFDDITKLNTVSHFQNCTVTLTDGEGGTKDLTIKNVNKNPNKMPEEMVNYFGKEARFSVTVPSDIVKTNATSTNGKTAVWTYALNDFTNAPETTFAVSFKK